MYWPATVTWNMSSASSSGLLRRVLDVLNGVPAGSFAGQHHDVDAHLAGGQFMFFESCFGDLPQFSRFRRDIVLGQSSVLGPGAVLYVADDE